MDSTAGSTSNGGRLVCYAAERNKNFILEVLRDKIINNHDYEETRLNEGYKILEIASGTGEHAALFAQSIPNVLYQPSEPDVGMHDSIRSWTKDLADKVLEPIAFDVNSHASMHSILPESFTNNQVDIMICINMIHISPFTATDSLFHVASKSLNKNGCLLTYGPYRVDGMMVESNQNFDLSLKARNPEWGVRDLEDVIEIAKKYNMVLSEKVSMPANNLSLIFRCL
eukprot:gene26793-35480_t